MHLARSVAGLVVGLALLWGFATGQLISSERYYTFSLTCIIGVIAPVWVMLSPDLWRRLGMSVSILCWCGAYVMATLMLGGNGTVSTFTELQVAIAGAALLAVPVGFAVRLADAVPDLESLQNLLTADNSAPARILERTSPEVELYVLQSRRSGRPLGMLSVRPEGASRHFAAKRVRGDIERAMTKRLLDLQVANLIGSNLRRVDLLIKGTADGFIVLCPEADAESLKSLADRISGTAEEELGLSVACGAAAFPDDGLTLDVLTKRAEANLQTENIVETSDPKWSRAKVSGTYNR